MSSGLSVCVLAHNTWVSPFGANGLELFLEHIIPHAEEVVLVDTSVDGCVSGRFSSVYNNVRVARSPRVGEPFDFSRERNYSLEHASQEWILVLDPDERMNDWRMVRNVVVGSDDVAYFLEGEFVVLPDEYLSRTKRLPGESGMHRLFRNGQGYFFLGRVFEVLAKGNDATSPPVSLKLECGWEHYQTISQRFERALWYKKNTETYDALPEIMKDLGKAWEKAEEDWKESLSA